MAELQPLNPTSTAEVPLPKAPLARVIAQVRFPPILAIHNPERVAVFQEEVREAYPHLSEERVPSLAPTGGQTPNVLQSLVWRFADRETDARWRVSLGVDFIALDTSSYSSRKDFLDRLRAVISSVEQTFKPTSVNRFGLRYIDRLVGEAFNQADKLVRPQALGILRPPDDQAAALGPSTIHMITEAQFLAENEARVQGRWGQLSANETYDRTLEPVDEPSWVLDLDMFMTKPLPFASEELLTTATDFSKCLYWLFREMVTEKFLKFYGGNP